MHLGQQVAGRLRGLHAAALHPQDAAARRAGRHRSFTRVAVEGRAPRSVAPSAASAKVTGTIDAQVRCRRARRPDAGAHATVSTRSPGSPPSGLGWPLPLQLDLLPVRPPRLGSSPLRARPPCCSRLTVSPLIAVVKSERRARRDVGALVGPPSRGPAGGLPKPPPPNMPPSRSLESAARCTWCACRDRPPPNMPPKTSSNPPAAGPPAVKPRARAHRADLVVLGARSRVGEHRVRLADLLEPRLGLRVTRVGVRVVLARRACGTSSSARPRTRPS